MFVTLILSNYIMHNAEQAKPVYQYKNTKIKLYKNNAAIWYNKTCSKILNLKNCALKLVDEIIHSETLLQAQCIFSKLHGVIQMTLIVIFST